MQVHRRRGRLDCVKPRGGQCVASGRLHGQDSKASSGHANLVAGGCPRSIKSSLKTRGRHLLSSPYPVFWKLGVQISGINFTQKTGFSIVSGTGKWLFEEGALPPWRGPNTGPVLSPHGKATLFFPVLKIDLFII